MSEQLTTLQLNFESLRVYSDKVWDCPDNGYEPQLDFSDVFDNTSVPEIMNDEDISHIVHPAMLDYLLQCDLSSDLEEEDYYHEEEEEVPTAPPATRPPPTQRPGHWTIGHGGHPHTCRTAMARTRSPRASSPVRSWSVCTGARRPATTSCTDETSPLLIAATAFHTYKN